MRSAVDFVFIAFIASLVSEILMYIDNGFHWLFTIKIPINGTTAFSTRVVVAKKRRD